MRNCLSVAMLALVLGPAFFVPPAHAQMDPTRVNVTVTPERNIIQPEENLILLVEQQIEPGWHTYWINPGDSGATPRVRWTLPDGFSVEEPQWPTPHAIPYADLMNFGYEGHVQSLQTLTSPAVLPDGPVTLNAAVEILVCKDICIPEFKTLTLTLNDGSPLVDNAAMVKAAARHIPAETDWSAQYHEDGNDLVLRVNSKYPQLWADAAPDSFHLFAEEWGLVRNAAPVRVESFDTNTLVLRQERDMARPLAEIPASAAVISFQKADGSTLGIEVQLNADPASVAVASSAAPVMPTETTTANPSGLLQAMLFALLGGLVLNLMPCVFPILSMKAMSLVQLREKGYGASLASGLLYTLGVVASFVAVAAVLLALKSGGQTLGWGFHLQNPAVTLGLAYLLFVIGLNFSGVFDIGGSFMGMGSGVLRRGGPLGSFMTGVLATIVATPCTAPFMAGALGFALVQPAPVALAVFVALGLGLALPYLILAAVPGAARLLPRPGMWMVRFKEFLAFPLYLSAAWMLWILVQQTGASAVLWGLGGMIAVAFALWVWRGSGRKILLLPLVVLAVLAALWPFVHPTVLGGVEPGVNGVASTLVDFTPAAHESALAGDDPVFVYMTAAWCITCKVNERVALDIDATRELFDDHNVTVLRGDWTRMNADITEFLKTHGRSGVPLYVYYGPRDKAGGTRPAPVVLPQVLTPGIIADLFKSTS